MSTFHEFEIDKAIISDLIHSQNGTISTAIRELVMNAIDAGSKTCHIKINAHSFSVADSGCGFQSKEKIQKVFKRFGEPHQEGDAMFGRFRIGRGQIMSFASVTWHSGAFKMHTDVKKHGNGFELSEDENNLYQGCRVFGHFYRNLKSWDISRIQEEITNLVKFAELDITFNGISLTEKNVCWDINDDDMKIKWSPNRIDGISLYSQGIFVKHINSHYYGISADIVTKRALKLNMARNEINDEDPLWLKIDAQLSEHSKELAKKEPKLSDERRKSLIFQLVSGSIKYKDIAHLALIKDCRGKAFSIRTLLSRRIPLTLTSTNNLIADEICNSKVATVLNANELRYWKATDITEWIGRLEKIIKEDARYYLLESLSNINIVDIEQLQSAYQHQLTTIKQSRLTPKQSAARNAIDYASKVMSGRLSSQLNTPINKRKVLLGNNSIVRAWTDGVSFIAINDSMIKYLDSGYYGAVQIALLLLHEYCHDNADTQSHGHDFMFYEKYHDLSTSIDNEIVGHTASSLYTRYLDELTRKRLGLPKEIHKQFKWPIINSLIEVTGQLESPLSDLAQSVLDVAPCDYKVTRNKIKICFCRSDYQKYRHVRDLIEKQIKEAGVALPDRNRIHALLDGDDYQSAMQIIDERSQAAYQQYADKSGLPLLFIKTLLHCYSHKDLLQGLCLDNGGLNYYEYPTITPIRVIGSAQAHYRHLLGVNSWDYERTPAAKIIQNSRIEYALNGITHIVNSITDRAERQRFIDTFFTENLANQIN
ncbi:ATP-binding protein [Photobacterium leiognathi]|uniref:ATP-binding protein n=1 Tax=Photobacterium leiognathi TaxID=553611 RepID=UPI0029822E6F|nr:ATP-binding protein [Photobacterium leiognathi]